MPRRAVLLSLALIASLTSVAGSARGTTPPPDPQVVLALIDTGINPYSPAFRDTSPLARAYPATYLPGYPPPCDGIPENPTTDCAVRLDLSLDAPSYAAALEADRLIWAGDESDPENFIEPLVRPRQLYWIPGTRIVGALSFGAGGRSCTRRVAGQPLPPVPPTTLLNGPCPEHPVLDDHGHGTMTSSRAAGAPNSLAPTARIVMIEGLGGASSLWAARQPWVDLQSNSWASLVPAPADRGNMEALKEAASRHLVLVASGNGLAFAGVAPTPTQLDSVGAPGTVLVGGHDNGRVTAWSGAPAHVVADAYAPYTAVWNDNQVFMRPDPVACCTSTAAPYAAGGAAAIALEARRLLGDTGVGVRNGAVAIGAAPAGVTGPLADGVLTLGEWRALLLATAQARPVEGRDDGKTHFMGAPSTPNHPEHGTGENPYCQFCWTLPVRWVDAPATVPAYASIGYGAINEHSTALARRVLLGEEPVPARPDEDAFFEHEDAVREAIFR